jgi:hypothetical protein
MDSLPDADPKTRTHRDEPACACLQHEAGDADIGHWTDDPSDAKEPAGSFNGSIRATCRMNSQNNSPTQQIILLKDNAPSRRYAVGSTRLASDHL